MTVIATAPAAARLDVGWVLGGFFRVLQRRGLDLLILGAPFVVLPNALVGFLPPELSLVGLAAGLPGLVFIGGASLITYNELASGERVGLGEAIGEGAGNFGSLWAVGLISNIATGLGLLLLIVPGVIVMSGWMSASSIVVVEDKTAMESLDRAWDLSRGSRWRLAGLMGLAAIAILLLVLLLSGAVIALTFALGQEMGTAWLKFLVTPIWTLLLVTLTSVGSAAAYTGLRKATEGHAGDVSAVFA